MFNLLTPFKKLFIRAGPVFFWWSIAGLFIGQSNYLVGESGLHGVLLNPVGVCWCPNKKKNNDDTKRNK